jgi:DNA-binding GntR family transcriptional regulator
MGQNMATKTRRIVSELRKRIEGGGLAPGDELPSQADLEREHGVSRNTARAVLAELERLGLVYRRRNLPAVVREHTRYPWVLTSYETDDGAAASADEDNGRDADPWAEQVLKQGNTPDETVAVTIEAAPKDIADRLGIDVGASVVVRRRERFVDGRLVQIADSYFPEEVAAGTLLTSPYPVHVRGGILAASGIHQVRRRDEIIPIIPTDEQRERLRLTGQVAVCEVTRTGYDADGRAVRVMVTLAPGDSNVIVIEQGTRAEGSGQQ